MIVRWYVCKVNGRYFKLQHEAGSIDELKAWNVMLNPVFGPCSVDEAEQFIEDMAPPPDDEVDEDGRYLDGRDDAPPTIHFFPPDDDDDYSGDISWKGE